MKNHPAHALASALLLLPAWSATPALALSDGASLDQALRAYRSETLRPVQWRNALLPSASVDAPAASADRRFMREIAYYTRQMLDRAGWVNPYAPDERYASGNYLVTVRIGDGVTLRTLA